MPTVSNVLEPRRKTPGITSSVLSLSLSIGGGGMAEATGRLEAFGRQRAVATSKRYAVVGVACVIEAFTFCVSTVPLS